MVTLDKVSKVIWLLVGCLMISVMSLAISIGIDIKSTVENMRYIWEDVTIEDMRSVLDVVEKQLDIDILSLELQRERASSPLEWTVENWSDYLDFCEEYRYVISDYTWQLYRYGRLVPIN